MTRIGVVLVCFLGCAGCLNLTGRIVADAGDAGIDVAGDPGPALDVVDVVDAADASDAMLETSADEDGAVTPEDALDGADVGDVSVDACPLTVCGGACVDPQTDVHHCGNCERDCTSLPDVVGAAVRCEAGACVIPSGACDAAHGDCDRDASNGCEVDLTRIANCGACGIACPAPSNGAAACAGGRCGIECDVGFHLCGSACVDDTAVATCGGRCDPCPTPARATATCASSLCGFTCEAGFGDCDGDGSNGCETDVRASGAHCGRCGSACTAPAGSVAACVSGRCEVMVTCPTGQMLCGGTCQTVGATCMAGVGACARTGTTLCGDGSVVCSATSGESSTEVCDGVDNDCDSMTDEAPAAAGCPSRANATGTCAAGVCGFACAPGFADCDGMASNGCEAELSRPATCGSCATTCMEPTPACVASSGTLGCASGCAPGQARCSGSCVELNSSPNHCGACGVACPVVTGGTAVCAGGTCTFVCATGYHACGGACADNTSPATCGASCSPCSVSGSGCVDGRCIPFPSSGAEGAFNPTTNTTLPPGVHNFTTINIPNGVTVTTSGTGVLDLRATGAVMIAGVIDLSGRDGVGFDGGGMGGSGNPGNIGGGGGNGGGPRGGSGGRSVCSGGCFSGGMGGGGGGGIAGGGGGGGGCCGSTGGAGGTVGGMRASGGVPGMPGQGGVASGSYGGANGRNGGGSVCGNPCNAPASGNGGGGGSIGSSAADLPVLSTFLPGSAGGGGGGGNEGGGGDGGGGGGALRIATPGALTVTGTLRVDGGAGRSGTSGGSGHGGGGGGGGSGGVIYVFAPRLDVTGSVSAVGGAGGTGGGAAGAGGAGGLGRIRISTIASSCMLRGMFAPPLVAGCASTPGGGTAGATFIGVFPD